MINVSSDICWESNCSKGFARRDAANHGLPEVATQLNWKNSIEFN